MLLHSHVVLLTVQSLSIGAHVNNKELEDGVVGVKQNSTRITGAEMTLWFCK